MDHDYFSHFRVLGDSLTAMLMLQSAPPETISGFKKFLITISALLFVSLVSGAFSGYLVNRDQDKDIAANTKLIELYKNTQDKEIAVIREELKDQRRTMMDMLRDIKQAVK